MILPVPIVHVDQNVPMDPVERENKENQKVRNKERKIEAIEPVQPAEGELINSQFTEMTAKIVRQAVRRK